MFVHPSQIAEVARRHPQIVKFRLAVDFDERKLDRMTLRCELREQEDEVEHE